MKHFFLAIGLAIMVPFSLLGQNESTLGSWGDPIPFGLVPVAVANLPNGNLITWSSQFRNSFKTEGDGITFTELFDPTANGGLGAALGTFTSNTNHDMFCPGINNLADGRILSAGGTSSEKTSIYDWRTNKWTVAEPMNIPRGYQGNVTLKDGSVFTIGGSWSGGSWRGRHAEIYSSLTGWLTLPNILGEHISVENDYEKEVQEAYRIDNHVWLWPAPNGHLFHAGPSEMMHWIDTDTPGGAIVEAGVRQDTNANVRDYYAMKGNTVMFTTGKILKTGGARAYGEAYNSTEPALPNSFIIDLNNLNYGDTPTVTFEGDLAFERTMHNSTVLPNGEVLVTGGLDRAAVFTDDGAQLGAEIFNETTGWREVAAMQTPRTYHSVAILMVDGRVFVGGGGLCDSSPGCNNHMDAEIYSPPYLFNPDNTLATRPVISSGPDSADYNTSIAVEATPNLQEFSLIRFSAATHSTNNEQRRIPVSFTETNGSYAIDIPNRALLPPGYYMLFGLNAAGVPTVAHTLQIGSEIPLSQNPNLVLDMQFDETTGTMATDSSQYGHTGTIVQRDEDGDVETNPNQHTWSQGLIGNALEFDGLEFNSNSLLEIDYSEELASTHRSITVSAWVYRNASSGIPDANDKIANVGILSHSYPNLFFGFHNTLYKWAFLADSPLDCYAGYAPLDTWVHLAATYDGSVAKLYANGVEICSRAVTGSIRMEDDLNSRFSKFTASGFYDHRYDPDDPLNPSASGIAGIPDYGNTSGITDEISGKMDLLKVYNKVLSPAEIQALYKEGFDTNNPDITNCAGNYLTAEYRIGPSGTWITLAEGDVLRAPEGSEVYIRAKDYNGEYIVTTPQYDGPTYSNIQNPDRFTTDNAYQIDTYVAIIPNFPPWDNPDRGNGLVDASNEGQFVLSTTDGCPTTIYFSLLQTDTGDGCPNFLPNDDPTIFITSGSLDAGLNEAKGTSIETNGSPCALEISNEIGDFARYVVSIDLDNYGLEPGNNLYLELDGKGDGNPYFEIRQNNSTAQSALASGYFGSEWTSINSTIPVPPNTETIDLWLYPNYSVQQSGIAYFDNLKIINLDATGGNLPPKAEFSINQTSGIAPLIVELDASPSTDTDGVIDNYEWDFGDGEVPSTLDNTSHTYSNPGIYLLTLSVFDDDGLRDRKTVTITVDDASNLPPNAVISANILSGNSPLTVYFTGDTSTDDNGIVSYAWDFGDGNTSNAQNPQHIFNTGGTYTVQLTVTDAESLTDATNLTITVNEAPVAVATASPLSGTAPLLVNFTGDTSTDDNAIVSYAWDFGDGSTSNAQNPQHIFNTGGTYTVQLTVTDAEGLTDATNLTITVNEMPVAVATATPLSGTAPLEVDFIGSNSTDDNGIVSYAWDFGDGSTTNTQNPQHIFNTGGTYTVQLTVTDAEGLTDATNLTITVNEMPVAVATATPLSGTAPLEVNFSGSNSTDDNGIVSYAWDFGDGSTTNTPNPQHTFNTGGTYTVQLTVTDAEGLTDATNLTITVNEAPVAVATANILSGNSPLTVDFTGSDSTDDNGVVSYAWDFGDGNTSVMANPQHTFTEVDEYTVSLTVTDAADATDTTTISISVNNLPNQFPTAVISANTISGTAPLEVNFTGSNSTDDNAIVSYAWDFGDGNTSNAQNPKHIFNIGGTFTVQLTVSDAEGLTDTTSLTITVNEKPVAVATATPLSGTAPLEVNFSGSNSTDDNGIVSYAWDFGDGNISDIANPQHTFTQINEYTVLLTVTDATGATDTTTISISVSNLPDQLPTAVISANPLSGTAPLQVDFTGSNSTDDNGIVSYAWDFGDGNTSDITNPVHTFTEVGEYLVVLTVTDTNGQTDTATMLITVNQPNNQAPIAIITATPLSGTAPLDVDFTGSNSTDDNGIVSYAWDFGDGANGNSANPQHTFTEVGEYLVRLTVTDANGASDTETVSILVVEAPVNCNAIVLEPFIVINNEEQIIVENSDSVSAMIGDQISIGLFSPEEPFAVQGPNSKELSSTPLTIENLSFSDEGDYTLVTGAGCTITISLEVNENEPLENFELKNIDVYPNPVRNETLKIDISKLDGKELNLGFYDIYGKLVLQIQKGATNDAILEVDVAILSSGMYLLEITKPENEEATIKKIIKIE